MATLWMRVESGALVPLDAGQFSREDELQRLLAEHPEILSSALGTTGTEERWLLIRRELPIGLDDEDERTRWSLDHLFIDGQGMPTLVEVKRSSDPRARREVVAQMLDYAASFRGHWRGGRLQAWWEDSVRDAGRDVDDELDRFLETTDFEDPQAFWAEVETKVAANRFRLLFVADRLSVGLVRIIEYLNEQMQTTEVVGVEILPHLGGGNANGLVAYAPAVRGRTTAVSTTKAPSERRTREEFNELLRARHGDASVHAVDELVTTAEANGGFISIGKDARSPQLFFNFRSTGTGRAFWPLGIKSRAGKVALQLRWLAHHPAFEDEDRRAAYVDRMQKAVDVEFESLRLDGFPGFPVELLTRDGVVGRVAEVLAWTVTQTESDRQSPVARAAET